MAKPLIFNGKAEKILDFLTLCRLFIRMKMRNNLVEEQVQWILLYVQGGLADIWKENIMEYLESMILYNSREFFIRSKGRIWWRR